MIFHLAVSFAWPLVPYSSKGEEMNRKIVFFDLDGTLLGKRSGKLFQIPGDALQAIDEMKRRGHMAVACTGRPIRFVRHFFPGVFDGIIASNGAHVTLGDEVLRDWILPESRVRELCRRFDSYGCHYFFIGNDRGWARNIESAPAELVESLLKSYFFPHFIAEKWEPHEIAANAMDFVFRDEAEFKAQLPAFQGEGMVFSRHANGLSGDLTLPGNNKGIGVNCLLAHMGASRKDTAAFGDSTGDLAMMRECGTAVAMGNATDDVKQYADFVTTAIFDGGVSQGLHRLGLI
ncbi:HAD family hydrolase [Thermocaproicibacter melissae]|jgi:Cof subfamily protein (haloacid dehalogenase superfamily)|uniref:HAD family hydrolase n=1 Tax=Thermocaproicibacter melissae TaxID=2966552 RepID=UPI003A100CA4